MFLSLSLAEIQDPTSVNELFARRTYSDHRDGWMLSTIWIDNTIQYNISMLGSLTISTEVGYHRVLNQTITCAAALNHIWQDLVVPHCRGQILATHALAPTQTLNDQAIDLLSQCIICGQSVASTRTLLASMPFIGEGKSTTVIFKAAILSRLRDCAASRQMRRSKDKVVGPVEVSRDSKSRVFGCPLRRELSGCARYQFRTPYL